MDEVRRTGFARNLALALYDKQISVENLAYDVGVTSAAISFYADGKRRPSLDTFVAIANRLGMSADELLKGELICREKKNPTATI